MSNPTSSQPSHSIRKNKKYYHKEEVPPTEEAKDNFKETVEIINTFAYNAKIDMAKKPFYTKVLPIYVYRVIAENRLFDISDQNEAAKIFLEALQLRRMRGNIIMRIFKKVKPFAFPNTTIKPSTLYFDKKKPAQVRLPQMKKVGILIEYVETLSTKYATAIMLAYYSGLRAAEIVSMKASTLVELSDQKQTVNILRKNGVWWRPIYYDQFNDFVSNHLNVKFREEIEKSKQVDSKLFNFTSRALHYFLCQYYIEANHEQPVLGFGIHVFRYYVASKLAEVGDLYLAQKFLAHKNLTSTMHYLKMDDKCFMQKLEAINKNVNLYSGLLKNSGENVESINKNLEELGAIF